MWLPLLCWLENRSQVFLPVVLHLLALPGLWAVWVVEKLVLSLGMVHVVAALIGYWVWKKQQIGSDQGKATLRNEVTGNGSEIYAAETLQQHM